jgi:hypothetical protein
MRLEAKTSVQLELFEARVEVVMLTSTRSLLTRGAPPTFGACPATWRGVYKETGAVCRRWVSSICRLASEFNQRQYGPYFDDGYERRNSLKVGVNEIIRFGESTVKLCNVKASLHGISARHQAAVCTLPSPIWEVLYLHFGVYEKVGTRSSFLVWPLRGIFEQRYCFQLCGSLILGGVQSLQKRIIVIRYILSALFSKL